MMKLNHTVFFLTFFLLRTAPAFTQTSSVAGTFSAERQTELNAALKSGDKDALGEAIAKISFEQVQASLFFDAIENAQQAAAIFESINKPKKVARTYSPMMWVHHAMHNLDKVEFYAQKMLTIGREQNDSVSLSRALEALCIVHTERKEYDKALTAALESYKIAEESHQNLPVTQINLSLAYSNMGKFEETRRYARLAAETLKAQKDTLYFAIAKFNEAQALVCLKRFGEAEATLKEADEATQAFNSPETDRMKHLTHALFYAERGEYEKAYKAQKEFYVLDSTKTSAEHFQQLTQIETAFQTKRKEQENERLANKVNIQRLTFGAAALALLSLGGFFYFQRNRLKVNNKLLKTEQILASEQLQRAEQELAFNKSELDNFTQSLREKTDAFEKLKADIDAQNATDERNNWHIQLMQASILTDDQWRNFRQKFERVHDGFFQKFTLTVPDATEAEQRLAALTKLEMTNTEIASMLGISPESVIKTRYRLRKKLGGESLEAVLNTHVSST
jgi:DNA-binding CsgD family transcriptional regulator